MPAVEGKLSEERLSGKETRAPIDEKARESPEEHLSQIQLDREAMEVVQEIQTWLGNRELKDMDKVRNNLYACKKGPVLREMVERLIEKLPFIKTIDPFPLHNGFRIVEERWDKPTTQTFHVQGKAYLIRCAVYSGAPTISGKLFEPGKAMLIEYSVEAGGVFEFLVLFPHSETSPLKPLAVLPSQDREHRPEKP